MADACLFISWNRPFSGRERETYSLLLSQGLEQLENFQRAGWFESYETIGLTPHGGSLNGFLLLRGERKKLDELRRSDDFERFSLQLGATLDGYGVVPGVTLEGLKKVRERNPNLFG